MPLGLKNNVFQTLKVTINNHGIGLSVKYRREITIYAVHFYYMNKAQSANTKSLIPISNLGEKKLSLLINISGMSCQKRWVPQELAVAITDTMRNIQLIVAI